MQTGPSGQDGLGDPSLHGRHEGEAHQDAGQRQGQSQAEQKKSEEFHAMDGRVRPLTPVRVSSKWIGPRCQSLKPRRFPSALNRRF